MINQEEYELLKQLDNRMRWISRDEDSDIFTFEEKPYKRGGEWVTAALWKDGSDFGHDYVDEVSLFQFIHWEDEEPYNIAELIEEYDKNQAYEIIESEEKEVKKNKEWAQKEVDRYLSYEGVNEARNALVFAKGVIDQLEEPEVLSQEWMKDNQLMKISPEGVVYYVPVENLRNLLVPKQEDLFNGKKPAIPKFMADYLYSARGDVSLMRVMELAHTRYELPKWEKEFDWISANHETFARAWLDGFTVEKEQEYYVINNDQRMMLVRMMDGKTITEADPFKLEDMYEVEKKSHRLTEREIKDYDPRYWAFATPVEELE